MADFCKQCAKEIFPTIERYDFEGLMTKAQVAEGCVIAVLCEGCGHTYVNNAGECVWKHCPIHGVKDA